MQVAFTFAFLLCLLNINNNNKLHPRIDPHSNENNLGVLLIEFFELYGKQFNYIRTGIRIRDGGSYIPKKDITKQFNNGCRPSILCIEDPLNSCKKSNLLFFSRFPCYTFFFNNLIFCTKTANDIGKGSYGALKVKQEFEHAYIALSEALANYLIKDNLSILGRIIQIKHEVIEYRRWIRDTYASNTSPWQFEASLAADMFAPCERKSSTSTSTSSSSSTSTTISTTSHGRHHHYDHNNNRNHQANHHHQSHHSHHQHHHNDNQRKSTNRVYFSNSNGNGNGNGGGGGKNSKRFCHNNNSNNNNNNN